MPALPPGSYTLTFTLSGMQTVTRKALVQLAQNTAVAAELGVQAMTESVTVTAETQYVDKTTAAITTGISNEQISNLPVGTQYRDLIKLIPGVQYTQDEVRGPSSGASGQDNVYKFDGVNVTLPLFGTLSAEPAAHDIAQVNVVKGGRPRGGLPARRRLRHRLGEQVGHQRVPRPGELPPPDAGHGGGA